jgi:hypothetical protein
MATAIGTRCWPATQEAHAREDTGAGGDNGVDHNNNWLRFPYDSTFLRSHDLQPHPYEQCGYRSSAQVVRGRRRRPHEG